MISGRFFTFDTKASTKGFSIFRYNRLRKMGNNDLPLSEQYPVYVFLDKEYLGFYINTYDDKKYNHELFSLPLLNDPSSDIAISDILEDISGQSESYYIYEPESTSRITDHTEGSPFYTLWFKEKQNDEQEQNDSNRKNKKYLYKDALLLDFLFDFAHSDVFKSNPHWQLLNARIETNPVLKAILCKGEWLFWRDKYATNAKENEKEKEISISQKHISEKRFDADEEWIEIIASEATPKMFLEADGWFDAAGDEMRRVLYGDKYSKNIENKIYFKLAEILAVSFYLITMANIGKIIPIWLSRECNWTVPLVILSCVTQIIIIYIHLFLIKKLSVSNEHLKSEERQNWLRTHFDNEKDKREQETLFDKIRISRNRIYHFFFNRFDFDDGFKWFMWQLKGNGYKGIVGIVLNYIIYLILINIVLFINKEPLKQFDYPFWNSFTIIPIIICSSFTIWYLPPFFFLEERKKRIAVSKYLTLSVSVFFIYFLWFIFMNWENLQVDWNRLSIFLMLSVLIIVILMPLGFIVEMVFVKNNKLKYPSIFHPGLTLPKTSLAMLTGWLVWVPIAEEAWKLNANVEWERIVIWLALMFLLAFVFIFFTLKGIQPELVVGNGLTSSALGVVVVGYAFAFGWGVLTTQFTCRQALDEPGTLMPYVFGETETFNDYIESKKNTLKFIVNFSKSKNSDKIVSIWEHSIRDLQVKDSKLKGQIEDNPIIIDKMKDLLRNTNQKWQVDTTKIAKLSVSLKVNTSNLETLAKTFNAKSDADKIKSMWVDSVKEFTCNFLKEKDSLYLLNAPKIVDSKCEIDDKKLLSILQNRQSEIVSTLIGSHAKKEKFLPAVASWKMWFTDWNIYIFPRMLLINSGIAFFLGFFAQIAFQSAGYKEPI